MSTIADDATDTNAAATQLPKGKKKKTEKATKATKTPKKKGTKAKAAPRAALKSKEAKKPAAKKATKATKKAAEENAIVPVEENAIVPVEEGVLVGVGADDWPYVARRAGTRKLALYTLAELKKKYPDNRLPSIVDPSDTNAHIPDAKLPALDKMRFAHESIQTYRGLMQDGVENELFRHGQTAALLGRQTLTLDIVDALRHSLHFNENAHLPLDHRSFEELVATAVYNRRELHQEDGALTNAGAVAIERYLTALNIPQKEWAQHVDGVTLKEMEDLKSMRKRKDGAKSAGKA